jgi:hypothetical protein
MTRSRSACDGASRIIAVAGLGHVDFVRGYIEQPPPADASVSLVISMTAQIRDPRATKILLLGATREDRMVRIAAASMLRTLPLEQADAVLATLLLEHGEVSQAGSCSAELAPAGVLRLQLRNLPSAVGEGPQELIGVVRAIGLDAVGRWVERDEEILAALVVQPQCHRVQGGDL